MTSIHEEADRLVLARQQAYEGVLADMYFMAGRFGDRETQRELWEEAWVCGNTRLLALLLLTETPLYASLR